MFKPDMYDTAHHVAVRRAPRQAELSLAQRPSVLGSSGIDFSSDRFAVGPNPMQVMTFPDTTVPLPDARTVANSSKQIASAARTGDVKMLQYHMDGAPRDIVNVRLDRKLTTLLLLTTRFAPSHDPDYPNFNANRAVEYLLRMCANPNDADSQGFTPLYEAARRGPAYFDALRALLQAGAKTTASNADGVTILHVALRKYSEDPVPVLRALIKAEANVNEKSQGGVTPLFVVARYCKDPVNAMALLLRAGADPNLESGFEIPGKEEGSKKAVGFGSPLVALAHYCAEPLPAMRLLVDAGADVRRARAQYVNVYAHGDEPIRSPNDIEALFRALRAAPEAPTPAVQNASAPAAINAEQIRGMEEHTLWSAAAGGREDIVAHYLKQRPYLFGHVSDKRHKGPSTYPLSHAVIGKQAKMVKFLIDALPALRADTDNPGPGLDVNARDGKGMTALLHGIRNDSQREVQLLLINGADPTLAGPLKPSKWYALGKRKPWENALMFAMDLGHVSCTRSILAWYNRNPGERINLDIVEKAAKASPNNMMTDCFNKFSRQRTLAGVARNQA